MRILISVAVLLSISCTSSPPSLADMPTSAILAAVRAVQANGSGVTPAVYCLGYRRLNAGRNGWTLYDPPAGVLDRLRADSIPVRPASECEMRGQGIKARMVERAQGRPAMELRLTDPPRLEDDTLTVDAAYSCGGLCGGGGPVLLWRRMGVWYAILRVKYAA